ncbi:MAG: IclR family transcriptional regulator [Sphaerochaetaceae bacterium]
MINNERSKENNNPSVDRALNILEHLIVEKSATIKELSEKLKIPPVSTSRLIKTLVNRGYLKEKKGYSSSFSLGMKLLRFSQVVYEQIDLRRIAEKYMQELSEATGQTSQLAILQQSSVIYINQVLPRKPVSIIAPLHTELPINVSACGKVLCAFLGEQDRNTCVRGAELIQATKKSIVDKDYFLKEMEKVKLLGYALDDEEFAKGIGCMAAPIIDYTDKIVAAVGITGHIKSYKGNEQFSKIKKHVLEASLKISEEIGHNNNHLQ